MGLLYNLAIHKYNLAIKFASLFNRKAAQWIKGRKGLFKKIESAIDAKSEHKIAWFHCASLGEFEQGRPVIEAFQQKYPTYKILLTFFSPSGYEVRKNYEKADWVFYLPNDTAANAKRFISQVNPAIAFFIKYEFWFNYLKEINKNHIPVYVVSAIFRPGQHFFKWYGSWFRKGLRRLNGIFVQNETSYKLLQNIGINNVWISGDTRFDRVTELVKNPGSFPLIERFAFGKTIFLGGSTWPPDEAIIAGMFQKLDKKLKLIIAPHEVHKEHIKQMLQIFNEEPLLYSEADNQNVTDHNILIIDSIGILSQLYQYAHYTYIGGGFNKAGIHNTLEAATYGKPIFFGPNYSKFQEAVDLVERKGAFSVTYEEELSSGMQNLLSNIRLYEKTARTSAAYVSEKQGATKQIVNIIDKHLAIENLIINR